MTGSGWHPRRQPPLHSIAGNGLLDRRMLPGISALFAGAASAGVTTSRRCRRRAP